MTEREYDVLVEVPFYKSVRVRAQNMAHAKRVLLGFETERFVGDYHPDLGPGIERVRDVVRAGEPWHHDRVALGGGEA